MIKYHDQRQSKEDRVYLAYGSRRRVHNDGRGGQEEETQEADDSSPLQLQIQSREIKLEVG